jgi:hypothetical protein
MHNQITINWSEAQEVAKEQNLNHQKDEKRFKKRIRKAKESFYDKLGSEDFRLQDFYDTLSDFDLDTDDLFHALI